MGAGGGGVNPGMRAGSAAPELPAGLQQGPDAAPPPPPGRPLQEARPPGGPRPPPQSLQSPWGASPGRPLPARPPRPPCTVATATASPGQPGCCSGGEPSRRPWGGEKRGGEERSWGAPSPQPPPRRGGSPAAAGMSSASSQGPLSWAITADGETKAGTWCREPGTGRTRCSASGWPFPARPRGPRPLGFYLPCALQLHRQQG